MARKMKIRAWDNGKSTSIKAIIFHPMETGLRKDKKTGKKIPAHFIQTVSGKHNGKEVVLAEWGPAVSKNPYVSFQFAGANKGDTVELTWFDNKGGSESASTKVR